MKVFISLIVFLTSSAVMAAEPRGVVKLQADVWCPFNCEEASKNPGYMVEVAKIAFDSIGMDVEYKNISWNKAIDRGRKGIINGIIGSAKNDAPDFTFPTVPIGRTKNCFYTLPDSTWHFTDVESLKKVRIGAIEGYTYGELFEKYVSDYFKEKEKQKGTMQLAAKKSKNDLDVNSAIQTVPGDGSLALNIKKIKAKRLEAFVEDDSVVKNHLYSEKLPENTYRNAGCLKSDEIFVAFGPTDPKGKEYAKLIGDTVVTMRKDGRLKKILEKYGINDWEN
ncbi:MAG TPA: ABC transporter substrate-binding protein [Oligoflexus sp.]|uniref:substrate-binding periplasmic protein n=1 Tax=Oligoflexus sp. TaxID=1971216 RepID=UPI002D285158|nr:ABC transporter substrate-binding protein [Oligoflexus sp.]HYX32389.1 ABC transporter substrate-binding protein [Oligoflexus sp.]